MKWMRRKKRAPLNTSPVPGPILESAVGLEWEHDLGFKSRLFGTYHPVLSAERSASVLAAEEEQLQIRIALLNEHRIVMLPFGNEMQSLSISGNHQVQVT